MIETEVKSGYRFIDEKGEHLHTLDSLPLHGTTTVIDKILSKPLTYWASGMACAEFGWINQKPSKGMKPTRESIISAALPMQEAIKKMTIEEYCALLDKAYRAHSVRKDKAADEGKELHSQIEAWIQSQIDKTPLLFVDPKIQPFVSWAEKNVKKFLWAEKCHYSRRLWVGGKSDFGYIDMDGNVVLGDIKSAKEAYLSHMLQAASYHIQIEENGIFTDSGESVLKGFKIAYYAIFPFGNGFVHPTIEKRTDMLKAGAEACLRLYHVKREFDGE